METEINEKRI